VSNRAWLKRDSDSARCSAGHSYFTAPRSNRGAAQASFVVYGLLRFQGEDWRSMPLEVRRAQLESLVSGIDGVTFSGAKIGFPAGDARPFALSDPCHLCYEVSL
jgi:hypothetical protein